MKIIQTIPNPTISGIFIELGKDTQKPWSKDCNDLNIEYYLGYSGEKETSPLYEKLIELEEDNIIPSSLEQIVSNIKTKFYDKWDRLWELLVDNKYNPIENYAMVEEETPNIVKDIISSEDGSSSEKQNSNIKTSGSQSANTSTFGFNSPTSVPTGSGDGTSESIVSGSKDDNYIENNDVRNRNVKESETGNRKLTRSGNIGVTTTQQMMEQELKIRKTSFYETMMDDIDSIVALEIYL